MIFCLRYGEWISKGRHLLDIRFLRCVDVCFRSTIWFANGKQKYQKVDTFFISVDVCFRSEIERTTLATRQPAKFNLYLRKGGTRQQHATLTHLLTIFPIKPCVIFWTGSPSSVPYTAKLEPGIFMNRMDFGTGQSTLKFPLVISVYRKIWTIV